MKTQVMNYTDTAVQKVEVVITSISKEQAKYNLNNDVGIKLLKVVKCKSEVIYKLNIALKRIVDVIGGIVGTAILIPLTLIVAILNAFNNDRGPIFYSHTRIGKDGKLFKMYKFRTMVVDADEKLAELLKQDENARKEWEENRKLKNDPRITKIGKFLRKTSIDEFPQFLNVLRGEMSLVGPRAVVEDEIEKFGIYKKDILSVKPGITGYWAANGRSDTTYQERVFMECKYANNFSIIMDIKILLKTVVSVLKKEGAV